jgi:threonine dehydratase
VTRAITLPTPFELSAARRDVARFLKPTPLISAPELGERVQLKLECLQPTGSFKVRGAIAAMSAVPATERVICASSGNHALAMAFAAAVLKRPLTVVVPKNAAPIKLEKLRRTRVRLVLHGSSSDEAERQALELAERSGEFFVSPYNDARVIAGQSTLGLELDAQTSSPLTVVCPVGGGGLLAGVALWARERPHVRVVGVEAAASRALSSSVVAGRAIEVPVENSIADGLVGQLEPGSITVDIGVEYVDDFAAVTEGELEEAIRALAFGVGIAAEGAGAAAIAAVLAGKVADPRPGAEIVAVISGRNLTRELLVAVLSGDEQPPERARSHLKAVQ